MFFSLFFSFFACQSGSSELSEQVTNQIVQQVVKEVTAELESAQKHISTETIKTAIQEEIQKKDTQQKDTQLSSPKFDPETHRKDLMSDRKSNQKAGELYVRVTGVAAYPKNNFKSRMEAAGRSKIREQAQIKNIPISAIDMDDMKVKKAKCDGSTCSANFLASYLIK